MLAVIGAYGIVFGVFWAIGHFFGHHVQTEVAWCVLAFLTAYYCNLIGRLKRRVDSLERRIPKQGMVVTHDKGKLVSLKVSDGKPYDD